MNITKYMRGKRTKYQTLTTKLETIMTTPSPYIRTYIAYASESGTAEKYARKLQSILSDKFNKTQYGGKTFRCEVVESEALLFIEGADIVLFVASTTGEGDPPKNGKRYYDNCVLFKYFQHVPFHDVHYAVFGIGSKLYKDNFCAFGLTLDKITEELGGTRILPVEKCDTNNEMEDMFSNWVSRLLPKIHWICRGYDIRHVHDNSTIGLHRTEPDVIGDINKLAKTASIDLDVVTAYVVDNE